MIAKGSLKHFMPTNGIYLYQRKLEDKEIFVILNGNDKEITTSMKRYNEVLREGETLTEILSGDKFVVSKNMTFAPRAIHILKNF